MQVSIILSGLTETSPLRGRLNSACMSVSAEYFHFAYGRNGEATLKMSHICLTTQKFLPILTALTKGMMQIGCMKSLGTGGFTALFQFARIAVVEDIAKKCEISLTSPNIGREILQNTIILALKDALGIL